MDIHEWQSQDRARDRERLQAEAEREARREHLRRNPPQSEIDRIEELDTAALIDMVFGTTEEANAMGALTTGNRAQITLATNEALVRRLRFKENWPKLHEVAARKLWRRYEEIALGAWSGTYPDITEDNRRKEQEEYERLRTATITYQS